MGVMQPIPSLGRLADTRSARELAARDLALGAIDPSEKLAWNWLLSNAEAYAAISAANGKILIYERLANQAMAETKAVFSEVGLDWSPETERFLLQSMKSEGSYYSVSRDPAKAINRWRKDLGDETIARVRSIVTRHEIGRMFFND